MLPPPYGMAMLAFAGINVILSISGLIYGNFAMGSWKPSLYDENVKTCQQKAIPVPGGYNPLACEVADLDCGDTKCYPGEFCAEKDNDTNDIKKGDCVRCTNSKR